LPNRTSQTSATAVSAVLSALRSGDDFLVAGHANPDGDAIGSTVAMGWLLRSLGKRFALYNASGMPEMFSWLELPGPLHSSLDGIPFTPRLAVILDSGNLRRAGGEIEALAPRLELVVNIDHHMDNPDYGGVNWVDRHFASVGEMIALLSSALGLPLSGPLGEAIYLTLVADTGYFRYDNTRPETMELGAELIRQGLNPGAFSAKYVNQWSLGRLQLWSEVLGQAKLFCNGQLGMLRITREILERTGTSIYDCDGLVDYVRRLRTVLVAAILREEPDGRTKISLRSTGNVNVQSMAARFGGGGHFNAAGASFDGDLDQAEAAVTELACQALQPHIQGSGHGS